MSVADNVISLASQGTIAGLVQASLRESWHLFKLLIARLPLITERYGTPGGSVMISPDKAKLAIVGKLEISPNSGSNERFSRLSGRPITA